jgi:NADH pyrophosphatase NudC (nudix superfamily)
VKNVVLRSKEFRAGMIYAANSTFPHNFLTIDVAILDESGRMLLGRKEFEKEFRFIGGFSDVEDETLEVTVKREAGEETGLEIDEIRYICSKNINDWRFAKETDRSIMTVFYSAKKIYGRETANDDIVEVRWFDIKTFDINSMVEGHRYLFERLKKSLNL